MTKSFMAFVATFVVLGISLGGAFVGGVAFGKSQDDAAPSLASLQSAPNLGQQSSGSFGGQRPGRVGGGFQSDGDAPLNLEQLRERFQSGDVTPEDLAQIRQRLGSGDINTGESDHLQQESSSRFGQGFQGRGGVTGTVEKNEGGVVTVDTLQGPVDVTIGADTVIQKTVLGSLEDLQEGVRIAVLSLSEHEGGGEREAGLVVVLPEGVDSPFGGGFFGGGGRRSGGGEGSFGGGRGSEGHQTP